MYQDYGAQGNGHAHTTPPRPEGGVMPQLGTASISSSSNFGGGGRPFSRDGSRYSVSPRNVTG